MKKIYFLFISLMALAVISCTKEELSTERFYGSWRLLAFVTHGASSLPETYLGSGTYIELKSTGVLSQYTDGKMTATEKIKIERRTADCSEPKGQKYWALEYESGSHEAIKVDKDTLTIYTPPCLYDGRVVTYVRMRN
ncbi:hypothetical protein [Niabella beijingensis]|uniref:hypothetical protein n=1 Tax=Niabella beijingensis TaxID=2872700 RepID=UPI001CC10F28|nr:hypothetical protein [Niabella beijingensis]MBZ4190144.1 hypothetical protein [Niabella beijingensis]